MKLFNCLYLVVISEGIQIDSHARWGELFKKYEL